MEHIISRPGTAFKMNNFDTLRYGYNDVDCEESKPSLANMVRFVALIRC